MGGRVKTLHPKIHGGLLGRRGIDEAVMREHGIEPIDLLAVNLYPFAATVARPDCTYEDAVENIDIGGPAMVRAAAKNHASVTVVVDPGDYRALLDELARQSRRHECRHAPEARRQGLRAHGAVRCHGVRVLHRRHRRRRDRRFPDDLNLSFRKHLDLRYGENPHQQAAFYTDPRAIGASVAQRRADSGQGTVVQQHRRQRHGARMRAAVRAPACVIVKHANPCGVALGRHASARPTSAPIRTDPTSAFGGIIAFNRELDAATARAILERQFVEVILAPSVASARQGACSRAKDNMRVLAVRRSVEAGHPAARIQERRRRPAGADPRSTA